MALTGEPGQTTDHLQPGGRNGDRLRHGRGDSGAAHGKRHCAGVPGCGAKRREHHPAGLPHVPSGFYRGESRTDGNIHDKEEVAKEILP